jgi:hypothetical protein
MLALPGNEQVRSINPLVAETNHGYLNDIRVRHVGRRSVSGDDRDGFAQGWRQDERRAGRAIPIDKTIANLRRYRAIQ